MLTAFFGKVDNFSHKHKLKLLDAYFLRIFAQFACIYKIKNLNICQQLNMKEKICQIQSTMIYWK